MQDIVQQILLLSLVFSRLIAMFLTLPFFNTALIPRNVKILLIVALSFFFIKNLHIKVDITSLTLFPLLVLLIKEALLGFALGLLVNIYIAAFSYAAEIISYFMGLTIANIFDPTYGQVSILSKFLIILFYLLFFITGAYQFFIVTIAKSFELFPLTTTTIHPGIWPFMITQSANLFLLAFKLAFPFALILYIVNLSLALINRLIPQINVFIVGLPMQIFIGLAALAIGASILVYLGSSYIDKLGQEYIYIIKHIGK